MRLRRRTIFWGLGGIAVILTVAGSVVARSNDGLLIHSLKIATDDTYRAEWLIQISSDLEYRTQQISNFPFFFQLSGRPLTKHFAEASLRKETNIQESEELKQLVSNTLSSADNYSELLAELNASTVKQGIFKPSVSPVFETNRDGYYATLGSDFYFSVENGQYSPCIKGQFVWITNLPNDYDGWVPLPNFFNELLGTHTQEALAYPVVSEFMKLDFDPDEIDPQIIWVNPSAFLAPLKDNGTITYPAYDLCGVQQSN